MFTVLKWKKEGNKIIIRIFFHNGMRKMYGIKFLNCPLDNSLICIICSLFAIRMTSEDWPWDLSSSLTFQLKALTSQCCSVSGKPALSLLGVRDSPINGLVHLLRAVVSSGSLLSGLAPQPLLGYSLLLANLYPISSLLCHSILSYSFLSFVSLHVIFCGQVPAICHPLLLS